MNLASVMLNRAGTVRRVVRRGERFVCGLCRSEYDSPDEAQACVQRCWPELLELNPVIERPRVGGIQFRCRFCARDYPVRHHAARCAESCRRQQIASYDIEMSLVDVVEGAPPRRFIPKPKMRMVMAPRAPLKTKAADIAPVNADEGTPAATPDAPAPAPAPVEPTKAAVAADDTAADGKTRLDDSHFIRDGARYVCKICKKKYFTREDVTACSESHGKPA